jgi:hypothetical protein
LLTLKKLPVGVVTTQPGQRVLFRLHAKHRDPNTELEEMLAEFEEDMRSTGRCRPMFPPMRRSARRRRLLHTIGNLTLLSEKLNPSVSNGPWAASNSATGKRKAVEKHTVLHLNKRTLQSSSAQKNGLKGRCCCCSTGEAEGTQGDSLRGP